MRFAILFMLLTAYVANARTLNEEIMLRPDGDAFISRLIAQGADVNKVYEEGLTPLTIASRRCMPKTAELLLRAGADINKSDKYGPPLFHSLIDNCGILTKILIDHGADARWVDKRNGANLLHYASVWGADSEVYDLINAGADINGLDSDGNSPLRVLLNWPDVAPWFKEERAELFKRYGAKDVYTRSRDPQTQPKPSNSERTNSDPDK